MDVKNIYNKYVKNINKNKIILLFVLMTIFSIIYTFLDDSNFAGVNKFQETIKEEVIKEKVKKEIIENYSNIQDNFNTKGIYENYNNKIDGFNDLYETYNNFIKEKIIDETTKKTEKEVENDELEIDKISPNIFIKFFNRLYFSIITGCLLGYGDIYPVTMIAKLISSIQGLTTIALIIS